MSETTPPIFDRAQLSIEDLARKLHDWLAQGEHPHEEAQIVSVQGDDYLGPGIHNLNRLQIHGSMGNYGLSAMADCECNVDGSAGDYLGYSIASGVIIVKGHVGSNLGVMGRGGFIAVYGNAGNRVGAFNDGADILVRGTVGDALGFGMRSGTILVGGNVGKGMGQGMTGGTIYVRGTITEVSPEIEEHRLREPDRLKLGLLLLKAGIKSSAAKDFRVYRCVEPDEIQ